MLFFLSSDTRLFGKRFNLSTKKDTRETVDILDAVAVSLKEDLREGSVSLPIYNFDFTSKGESSSKLKTITTGAFNYYVYQHHSEWQSLDPIFAVCGWGPPRFAQIENEKRYKPFGDGSVFEDHVRNSFTYISLGLGMSEIATLMHYVETVNLHGPLYRYDKNFFGVHEIGRIKYNLYIEMHCRPKGIALEYDVKRLNNDLEKEGIVRPFSMYPRSFLANAAQIFNYWNERRAVDPFYFLKRDSRNLVERKLQSLGRPFREADFE